MKRLTFRTVIVLGCIAVGAVLPGTLFGASFTRLPFLPTALSGDGRYAFGAMGFGINDIRLVRWSQSGGLEQVIDRNLRPYDANFDGSVIVGTTVLGEDRAGFRYSAGDGVQLLTREVSLDDGDAYAVSSNGAIVVGAVDFDNPGEEAFKWVPSNGTVLLGRLPGQYPDGELASSEALDVSDDGGVIVGSSKDVERSGSVPVRWVNDLGPLRLPLPAGDVLGVAQAVSADGEIIFGVTAGRAQRPFRWTQTTGTVSIDLLPEHDWSQVVDASADGSVFVGVSNTSTFSDQTVFIWDAIHGVRDLEEVVALLDIDLAGAQLTEVFGLSDDGRTIIGAGRESHGVTGFQWIATVPEPSSFLLASFAIMTCTAFTRYSKRFG